MKKIALLLALLTVFALMFTACEAHTHEFDDAWSNDADYHWHACEAIDGCPETSEKAAHDFEVTFDEEGNPINKCKVCDYYNDKVSTADPHEHVFADAYAKSENYHWYQCTVECCFETKDKAEHLFSNPEIVYEDSKMTITRTCLECGYESIETQNVKTEVDNALSWDEAFKQFKLVNFTMDVNFKSSGQTHVNHCVITEDSAYYCIPSAREFYCARNPDGTCDTYYKEGTTAGNNEYPFSKLDSTSDDYLLNAQRETVIQVSFEENFDKFTYDEATATYVCAEAIEAICTSFDGSMNRTLYCYNNVVTIVDGRITTISADYYFFESELDYETKSFSYYNVGMSEVNIPEYVKNGTTP